MAGGRGGSASDRHCGRGRRRSASSSGCASLPISTSLSSSESVGEGDSLRHQSERHEQRAEQDRVGERVGQRLEPLAIAIELAERAPERLFRGAAMQLRRDGLRAARARPAGGTSSRPRPIAAPCRTPRSAAPATRWRSGDRGSGSPRPPAGRARSRAARRTRRPTRWPPTSPARSATSASHGWRGVRRGRRLALELLRARVEAAAALDVGRLVQVVVVLVGPGDGADGREHLVGQLRPVGVRQGRGRDADDDLGAVDLPRAMWGSERVGGPGRSPRAAPAGRSA